MSLNTEHLEHCLETLESAYNQLLKAEKSTIDYEVFRNATIKGFELVLELSGKLLRKKLKAYFASPKEVDQLTFKDVFRHAAKHSLMTTDEVNRWFEYRDNRNTTAYDYGESFF